MQGKSVYQVWEEKYGADTADEKMSVLKNKRSENAKGRNNPMWGKSAPVGSGSGWSGWYSGIYFRSLLELSFMLQLEAEGVQYTSAECRRFRVKYFYQNKECTYYPDFYLPEEGIVVELKPFQRTQEGRFLAKQEAASKIFNYRVVTDVDVKTISRSQLLELVQKERVTLIKRWADRLGVV